MSTVQMQIRLAPTVAKDFEEMTPRWKGRAVAALLTCAVEHVNVTELLDAVEDLRQAGDNLNQALVQSHRARKMGLPFMDAGTVTRVRDYLDFLECIRGRA